MILNSEIIRDTTNIDSLIMKSENNFNELLYNVWKSDTKCGIKVNKDIYLGLYDGKKYQFVHQCITFLLLQILNNITLQCPFWKNKIKFVKSIDDFKISYRRLSGIYTIKGESLPNGFDLGCIVSTVPVRKYNTNVNVKFIQSYSIIKKLCEHFNTIILKTKIPNICISFYSITCKSGLRMKTSHLTNKRLIGQVMQWKTLLKNNKISKNLCYTVAEIPTLTLHKYLQTSSFEIPEWKSILFQLSFTMRLLSKEIPGFVHHDLTTKRVYLKRVPKGGQFVYIVNKKKFYVPNYGYIVKILPSSFSYTKRLYENQTVHDDTLQLTMGLNPENTQFYDLHLFFNTLYFTKNVPRFIKTLARSVIPKEYLTDKNTSSIINRRLRMHISKLHKVNFSFILNNDSMASMRKINKKRILFQSDYKL